MEGIWWRHRWRRHLEEASGGGTAEGHFSFKKNVFCKNCVLLIAPMQVFGDQTHQVLFFAGKNARRRRGRADKPFEALHQDRKNPYSATLFGE